MKNICIVFSIMAIMIFGCDRQENHNESPSELLYIDNNSNEGDSVRLNIEKDKNGKITSICNYRNELQHGICRFYFHNGQVKEEGNFFYGLPIDTFRFYDDKGLLKAIREYQIVKGESVVNQYQFFDDNEKIIKNY